MSSKKNLAWNDRVESSQVSTLENEIIGLSEQRRPLIITYLGSKCITSQFKILIMAGQHGDERYGRRAVSSLVASLAPSFSVDFSSTSLAILSDLNPDGSYQKTRRNSVHVDLNRDHQKLDSQEVRAIHSFVRSWKPHVIIDVHNYPSRRKHLLAKNLIYYPDIFIDIPTNPAIQALDIEKKDDLFKTMQRDLAAKNISIDRYTIVKPSGRVRHSTGDITDARNFLSLRYNTLTILLEGRTPTREEGMNGKIHIISAQYHALRSLLKWAHKYQKHFMEKERYIPSVKDEIAIQARYSRAQHPLKMNFKNSITKMVNGVVFDNYTELNVTKFIELPSAYAVPCDKQKIIELLHRHGFISKFSNHAKTEPVEYYVINSLKPSSRENRTPKIISLITRKEARRLYNYIIFPTNQQGGHCLAIFLEPESKYGLHRYNDLNLHILSNSVYPILRVL